MPLFHTLDAGTHGDEVREHATEPTLIDVGHVRTLSLRGDCLLGLLLCADEEDGAAASGSFAQNGVCTVRIDDRLLEVEDVDAVALTKDVGTHLRVPATSLVPVMAPCVEQRLDVDLYSHVNLLWLVLRVRSFPPIHPSRGCNPGTTDEESSRVCRISCLCTTIANSTIRTMT